MGIRWYRYTPLSPPPGPALALWPWPCPRPAPWISTRTGPAMVFHPVEGGESYAKIGENDCSITFLGLLSINNDKNKTKKIWSSMKLVSILPVVPHKAVAEVSE